ncbi:MAG: type I-PGING CRISPR-associated protein Cas7/Csp1 [Bacteroidetes bacterium]|nr:type I-PGING CRISPR-associated protein Cas7/Csp1 [Bacteroidota bacterium]
MIIQSITVTLLAPMEDHAANRGEKLLGNASSIKRRPDGRVYVSGQMQRHALFSAMARINDADEQRGQTFVANGDAPTTDIATDLRSDLGGFLDTNKGDYSGRRTAPLSATPAVAQDESAIGRDLLIRIKQDEGGESDKKQALATNEFSQRDVMRMSFHLDVPAIGTTTRFRYDNKMHVRTEHEHHIDDAEHRRRVVLALEATRSLTDYANQARNATSGEPEQVLIVLDTKMSRKAARFFAPETTDATRKNLLNELDARGAVYFLGDDTTLEGDSVEEAYDKALAALQSATLYRPAHTYTPPKKDGTAG